MSDFTHTEYGRISDGFSKAKLVDLCSDKDGVQTGPFGSQLHKKDYVEIGTPIITVEHLDSGFINGDNAPRVKDEDRERLIKYTLREGDIVFSRVGSVDRRSLVRKNEDGWMFSGRCLRVRAKPELIDSSYLSYFFGTESFKDHIRSIAVGATMPSINTKILSDVRVFYPPLPEQKAIAHILGKLDDKIALNRQMNQTLEAMAQALFKSWFVDFDPVLDNVLAAGNEVPEALKDKAVKRQAVPNEKKLLHTNPELAEGFPNKFEYNETLGKWIPEGWEVKRMDEFSKLQGGFVHNTKLQGECVTRIAKMGVVSKNDLFNEKSVFEYPDFVDPKFKLEHNDIVVCTRDVTADRIIIGNVAITPKKLAEKGVYSGSNTWIIRTEMNKLFLFLMLRNIEIRKDIISKCKGTTIVMITKNDFLGVNIVLPPLNHLKSAFTIIERSFDKISDNNENTETLTQLRDTLLPQLISGKVRLSDEIVNQFQN